MRIDYVSSSRAGNASCVDAASLPQPNGECALSQAVNQSIEPASRGLELPSPQTFPSPSRHSTTTHLPIARQQPTMSSQQPPPPQDPAEQGSSNTAAQPAPATAGAGPAAGPAQQQQQQQQGGGGEKEVSGDAPLVDPRLPTRKDTSLREFLAKIDDYAPIVRVLPTPPLLPISPHQQPASPV